MALCFSASYLFFFILLPWDFSSTSSILFACPSIDTPLELARLFSLLLALLLEYIFLP
jgi:hypothetical protein